MQIPTSTWQHLNKTVPLWAKNETFTIALANFTTKLDRFAIYYEQIVQTRPLQSWTIPVEDQN